MSEENSSSNSIICMLSNAFLNRPIGPLHDPVTWYGINYAGTQDTQWDHGTSKTKEVVPVQPTVPLCSLRPSIITSVPCDRLVQMAYF